MADSKTLIMELVDGKSDGVKLCRCQPSNSMQMVVVPKRHMAEAEALPNLPSQGVYYLLAISKGVIVDAIASVTNNGVNVLASNDAYELWNTAIFFLMDNADMPLNVLDALEKRMNGVRHGSKSAEPIEVSPESATLDGNGLLDEIYGSIKFMLTACGYDLSFIQESAEPTVLYTDSQDALIRSESDPVLLDVFITSHKRGMKAHGKFNLVDHSVEVLPGSQIAVVMLANSKIASDTRDKLSFRDGITDVTEGIGTLTHPVRFNSPSTAAKFVLGSTRNGWKEWRSADGVPIGVLRT